MKIKSFFSAVRKVLPLVAIFLIAASLSGKAQAANEKLGLFLRTSAYGAAFGAGAGLTSLAFNDQPSKNLNHVARGASLGLYAGMAVGLYLISAEPSQNSRSTLNSKSNFKSAAVFVLPQADGLLAGLTLAIR